MGSDFATSQIVNRHSLGECQNHWGVWLTIWGAAKYSPIELVKSLFKMWQRAFHAHCRRYIIYYELELLCMMFGECSSQMSDTYLVCPYSSVECPTHVFPEFRSGHAIKALTA